MQVTTPNSSFTGNTASSPSSNAAGNSNAPSFQSLLDQLNNYVKETPAQRMFDSILAQLGITPQQLQNMSPADREKVEKKVSELMKKEVKEQQQQQQQQQQVQSQIQQPASQSNTSSSPRHNKPSIDFSI
jgi:sulfite reductase alpha subunit-like flavoprotein